MILLHALLPPLYDSLLDRFGRPHFLDSVLGIFLQLTGVRHPLFLVLYGVSHPSPTNASPPCSRESRLPLLAISFFLISQWHFPFFADANDFHFFNVGTADNTPDPSVRSVPPMGYFVRRFFRPAPPSPLLRCRRLRPSYTCHLRAAELPLEEAVFSCACNRLWLPMQFGPFLPVLPSHFLRWVHRPFSDDSPLGSFFPSLVKFTSTLQLSPLSHYPFIWPHYALT